MSASSKVPMVARILWLSIRLLRLVSEHYVLTGAARVIEQIQATRCSVLVRRAPLDGLHLRSFISNSNFIASNLLVMLEVLFSCRIHPDRVGIRV